MNYILRVNLFHKGKVGKPLLAIRVYGASSENAAKGMATPLIHQRFAEGDYVITDCKPEEPKEGEATRIGVSITRWSKDFD